MSEKNRAAHVLSRNQIGRANARGDLNVVVINSGLKLIGMSEAEARSLMALGPETFLRVHGGFQIKQVVIEPPEELSKQFMLSSGFVERAFPPSGKQRPSLVGLSRVEAKADLGTYAARIFVFQPPRIIFSEREQELLACALDGCTDEESAEVLSLSLATVKTRWKQIYQRVTLADPTLLPENDICPGQSQVRRGSEKRRHLVSYLRLHPEELRPYMA